MTHKGRNLILLLLVLMIAAAVITGTVHPWQQNGEANREKGYVAVIRIDGPIYGGADSESPWADVSGAASERLMREFRQAREDSRAKAVLVRINSPGGSSAATQEIAEEIDKLRSSGKPVVISMGDMCASAGYWLACKGDYIFANPSTITGSIGVYMDYTNVEDLLGKLGVKNDIIKSGPHKDILSMYRPMTDEERAMLQQMVDDIYHQFVRVVADGRHMDEAQVEKLADGRVFTGRQAQDVGLVDAMGNYYDALGYAGSRVGITSSRIPTHSYEQKVTLRGIFSSEMQNSFADALASRLTGYLKEALDNSGPAIR